MTDVEHEGPKDIRKYMLVKRSRRNKGDTLHIAITAYDVGNIRVGGLDGSDSSELTALMGGQPAEGPAWAHVGFYVARMIHEFACMQRKKKVA